MRQFRRGDELWEIWIEDAPGDTDYWTGEPIPQKYVVERTATVGEVGTITRGRVRVQEASDVVERTIKHRRANGYVERVERRVAGAADRPRLANVPIGAIRLVHDLHGFWQIQQDGARLLVTSGKLGTDGERFERTLESAEAAATERDEQIAKKQRKGFRVVHGAPVAPARSAVDEALERQILDEPERDELFAVYADWLEQQGDPRGTLAALQMSRVSDPEPARDELIETAEDKLLWEQRAHFYGPLAPYVPPRPLADMFVAARWRHGFMESLSLSAVSPWAPQVERLATLVDALPALRSARFLRALSIAGGTELDDLDSTRDAVVRAVDGLPLLRALALGADPHDEPGRWWPAFEDPAGELWRACQRLVVVEIRASRVDLFRITDPRSERFTFSELKTFAIHTAQLSRESIEPLTRMHFPVLERFTLWFGPLRHDYAWLLRIVDENMPSLAHLGLCNTPRGPALVQALLASPVLGRIDSLDLSGSHITRGEVELLAQHRGAFSLRRLDLSRCVLDAPAMAIARTLARDVILDEQEDFAHYEEIGVNVTNRRDHHGYHLVDEEGVYEFHVRPPHCSVRNPD